MEAKVATYLHPAALQWASGIGEVAQLTGGLSSSSHPLALNG